MAIGSLTLLLTLFLGWMTWRENRRNVEDLIATQAAMALEFDLAIRDYVGQSIRPEMEKRVAPNEFVLEAMSTSYVARNIFQRVNARFPDYILKFSSENPRNPVNRAGPE
jgi:hypothetical protein